MPSRKGSMTIGQQLGNVELGGGGTAELEGVSNTEDPQLHSTSSPADRMPVRPAHSVGGKVMRRILDRDTLVFCSPTFFVLGLVILGFSMMIPPEHTDTRTRAKPILLAAVRNWNFGLYCMVPVLLTMLTWQSMAHAKRVANENFINEGAESERRAVHEASQVYGVYFHAFLIVVIFSLLYATAFGGAAAVISYYGVIWGIGGVMMMVLLTRLIRNLSVATVRRELVNTAFYIQSTSSPRMAVTVALQILGAAFIWGVVLNAPLGCLGETGKLDSNYGGYPSAEQCAFDVNATYLASHCNLEHHLEDGSLVSTIPWRTRSYKSYVTSGGSMQCNDGGFGVYASLYDACVTWLEVEGPINTRVHDMLWANVQATFTVVSREIVTGLDESLQWTAFIVPRLDLSNKCSRTLTIAVVFVCISALVFPFLWVAALTLLQPEFFSNWHLLLPCAIASVLLCIEFGIQKYERTQPSTLLSKKEEELLRETLAQNTISPREEVHNSFKFLAELNTLITGQPKEAALGLPNLINVSEFELYGKCAGGIEAIKQEIAQFGTTEDQECLDYVLNQEAGSSPTRFANSSYPRDHDANGVHPDRVVLATGKGMRFEDFVNHEHCQTARLSEPNVLALRLYTTWAFKSINSPLRDAKRTGAHPLPVTVVFLADGIKRLRARASYQADADGEVALWRGMRDMKTDEHFMSKGGSERAPMSTTSKIDVAAQYSASGNGGLLFKVHTASFLERGVDLTFLSAFPGEAEYLYPPLTYLRPTGATQKVTEGGATFTIVEVTPIIA